MATANVANSKKLALQYDGPFKILDLPSEEDALIVHTKDNTKSQLVHRNLLKTKYELLKENGFKVNVTTGQIIFAYSGGDRLWWPAEVMTFDKLPPKHRKDYNCIPVQFIYGEDSLTRKSGVIEPVNILSFLDGVKQFGKKRTIGLQAAIARARKMYDILHGKKTDSSKE
jgi:hypothetical protein